MNKTAVERARQIAGRVEGYMRPAQASFLAELIRDAIQDAEERGRNEEREACLQEVKHYAREELCSDGCMVRTVVSDIYHDIRARKTKESAT